MPDTNNSYHRMPRGPYHDFSDLFSRNPKYSAGLLLSVLGLAGCTVGMVEALKVSDDLLPGIAMVGIALFTIATYLSARALYHEYKRANPPGPQNPSLLDCVFGYRPH